jgi:trans-aconitate 2-methyltransferase
MGILQAVQTNEPRWDLGQYEKFRRERMAPFFDLLALLKPRAGLRVVDLGCGSGELTAMLATELPDSRIEGLDSSEDMLKGAAARASERVTFRRADIATLDDFSPFDLVFSNATFHWIPDNERLMRTILGTLKPGAQVLVQLPRNDEHASHRVADALASEAPYRDWLGGFVRKSGALSLERYAELFHIYGFEDAVCVDKIYGHTLAGGVSDVVEWVKGTALVPYLSRFDVAQKAAFLDAYRERLTAAIGDAKPYFFTYRRTLLWGLHRGQ